MLSKSGSSKSPEFRFQKALNILIPEQVRWLHSNRWTFSRLWQVSLKDTLNQDTSNQMKNFIESDESGEFFGRIIEFYTMSTDGYHSNG